MDTRINKSVISEWGINIFNLNNDAITCLSDIKNLTNAISDSYKSVSSNATIINMITDLDNAITCHTNMQNLQGFLQSVVDNAEKI